MKTCFGQLAAACIVAAVCLPAYASAQEAQSGTPPADASATPAQVSPASASAWQPADSQPGKTRAEVQQELVHAQQDGELAYLNRTVYAHH
jgi:multidrug efflux pump subunit AcrA (membrane-fusion protein)